MAGNGEIPDNKGNYRDPNNGRGKNGGDFVGQSLDGSLGALSLLYKFNYVRKSGL
jgi:hypothetical protein